MGNVFAAAPPQKPSALGLQVIAPPITASPPGSSQLGATQSPTPSTTSTIEDNHPGTYEDLHKKCKDLFPQVFDGAKLVISKGLSNHFQISHTMSLSTFQPAEYRFGATYVGRKQFSPQEAYPVLLGDIDASGNLNAHVIHAWTEKIRSKFVTQIQGGKCQASQFSTDYKGKDFSATIALANPDIVNESGLVVGQYLQRVTSNFDLGAEAFYQYGSQVPGGELSLFSIAARLKGQKWQLSGNISPAAGGLHACYYHKINDQLQVGAELETSLRLQESVGTIGYQLEIPSAAVTFRGKF
ncbi:hypothetical protein CHS0354_021174 [Potamilus streckersoni]|uniref:Mitochondrial import receptor subunit TOM40 n=1 Tax=Potamilus streckersoni TaxID=2493646 RepID=A0AAE0S377_9BIVA|nr:hypothetical protein CHS0354_021174 [Potamilus streckersoni]